MRMMPVILGSAFAATATVSAVDASAQTTPPGALTTYVTAANGASQNQINTAAAVQGMCNYLKNVEGYTTAATAAGPPLNTPMGDLFLRCNELVQTAAQLSGTKTTRSLGLPGSGLFGALQQVSGIQLAAQGTLTTQVPAGQFANIGNRISALRYGAADAGLRGRVSAYDAPPDDAGGYTAPVVGAYHFSSNDDDGASAEGVHAGFMRATYTTFTDDSPAPSASGRSPMTATAVVPNPWGVFVEGSYNFGSRDQTAGEDAFNYYAKSVTLGLDYNFGGAVVGATVGYDTYKANFEANGVSDGGGYASVEGTSGSVFAAWFGQHWYFDGIASYGGLNNDVVRVVSYAPVVQTPPQCQSYACGADVALRGSPGGKDTAVGATAGYDLTAGRWNLSPNLSLNYRRVDIDSYGETDLDLATTTVGSGLPLRYASQSIDSFRSGLGFTASTPLSFGFGVLTPNLKIEWDHEFKNEARTIEAQYIQDNSLTTGTQCVSCFLIPTEKPARDFGTAGVGLSALFPNRIQAYVYYERLVGVSYLTGNSITLGLRGQF